MYIISTASRAKVYHQQNCPYVNRIANEHYLEIRNKIAKRRGLHPCHCCGKLTDTETPEIIFQRSCRQAQFTCELKPEQKRIFVKTPVGFWKLQENSFGQYALYHSSGFDASVTTEVLKRRPFHRQSDVPETASLEKLFIYIQRHEKAKEIIADDYRKLPQNTKQEKRYYRQAKKRARRKDYRRMEHIFDMIAAGANNREILAY